MPRLTMTPKESLVGKATLTRNDFIKSEVRYLAKLSNSTFEELTREYNGRTCINAGSPGLGTFREYSQADIILFMLAQDLKKLKIPPISFMRKFEIQKKVLLNKDINMNAGGVSLIIEVPLTVRVFKTRLLRASKGLEL